MDHNERTLEDCQATWREDPHSRAVQEAASAGFTGTEREGFMRARKSTLCGAGKDRRGKHRINAGPAIELGAARIQLTY
jgi:hypothetical protein